MREVVVIRLIKGQLAWYPPGASQGVQWLDQDSAQESLHSVLGQRKLTPVFAVPGEELRLLSLPVAQEERRHLSKSLPFMLEEELSQDITELHFASAAVDKSNYSVAVCTREKMAEYQSQLAAFPGVNQWLPEPLLLPWQPGEWCLVLEDERAVVRIGASEGFAVERQMLPLLLNAVIEAGQSPEAIILYGEDQADDIALLPADLREMVQWRKGDLYAAMLLAELPSHGLNLRQGEWAVRLPLKRWWQQWRVAATVFGAAVAVHMLATWADYRQLQEENLALRGAVQESYRQAFPRGAVVDPEKQLRRQLESLSGSTQSSGFVALLGKVAEVVKVADGSVVSINYNDKAAELRLNLLAANYEAVERIRNGFTEAGLEATLENSSAQGDKVRARMRVGGRS